MAGPAMFTVFSQLRFRHGHAVTSEIPACSQNLCRLWMGLPSIGKNGCVFIPAAVHHHPVLMKQIRTLEPEGPGTKLRARVYSAVYQTFHAEAHRQNDAAPCDR